MLFKNKNRSEILDQIESFSDLSTSNNFLRKCKELLDDVGINVNIDGLPEEAQFILIAEAVNWAAKTINVDFYELKGQLIEEAVFTSSSKSELRFGWNKDEWENDVFFLFHPEVGTASFHDPNCEINVNYNIKWDHEWSGISRQDQAFDLLEDSKLRYYMAEVTTP